MTYIVHAEKPRLLVFGAVDFSAALCAAGALLGYRVTVCDARPVFATAERFPPPTRWSSSGPPTTSRARPSTSAR
ncbi:XdhC family protein [Rathayibacter oskolensis]|uniref:XdhC family protein n=1 Tax=Rathayibacter oskolensis TaxID=1891671 RepID=UPI0034669BCF